MALKLKYSIAFFSLLIGSAGMSLHNYKNTHPINSECMPDQTTKYGIEGYYAPELTPDIEWVDGHGEEMESIQLSDFKGKFKVLYGFQSWCPGCHSIGLPALKKMVDALKDNDQIEFFAMQTVFEGFHANTKEKMLETQKKYKLDIPFGHDVGNQNTGDRSSTMYNYRTGGTPWFIFINQQDTVVFNNFHLDVDKSIEYLLSVTSGQSN